jgi:hypothetical protein
VRVIAREGSLELQPPVDQDAHTLDGAADWTPEGGSADDEEFVNWTDYSADAGNGVKCQNCGSHVSKQFVKVFEGADEGRPRCCPNCDDLVREGDGTVREKRTA